MKKQYIFILLFVTHLILGQTPTGTSAEVGITEGQLSVSLSGAATYSIPVAVPPGINGTVPQVSLVYNSQGANGLAGYGWNVAGLSAIRRISSTKFHDGEIDAVDFDNLDRFALDGQRLILKSGTSGADGSSYVTENFSNVNISIMPNFSGYPPGSFLVTYPDGSRALYSTRSGTTWGITYWENAQGVRISYTYNDTNNSLSIASINYGSLGTTAPINKIQFNYNTANQPQESYEGGYKILQDKILNNIIVTSNNIGFRSYQLAYNTNSVGYQRLTSITEKSGDNTKSYNPTVFSYEDTSDSISYAGNNTNLNLGGNGSSYQTVSGDFSDDEKMEFIVYPTTGTGSKAKYWLYSNVSSGGYTNISNEHNVGAFESIFPTSWLSSGNHLMPKQGWTIVKKTDTNYTFTIYSFSGTQTILTQYNRVVNFPIESNCSNKIIPKLILPGDFNGDGLTDVMAIDNGCFSKKVYFVDLKRDNTANFLTYSGELPATIITGSKVEVADVNGDGKSDIMVFEKGIVSCYTLNNTNQLVLLWNYSDTNIMPDLIKTIILGDYNGDGKMDFLIPSASNSTTWYKYSSTGIGFIKTTQTYTGIPYLTNQIGNIYRYFGSDYDKDGKADLILNNIFRNSANTLGTLTISCYKNIGGIFSSSYSVSSTSTPQADINLSILPIYTFADKATVPKDKPYNSPLEIAFLSNSKIFYFNSTKDNTKDQLLKSIKTGNGVTKFITYRPLNASSFGTYGPVYNSSLSEIYPNSNIESSSSMQVVSMLENQSATDYKKQVYSYYDGVSNVEGLGFLGFKATARTNWFNNNNDIISTVSKFDSNLRGANIESFTALGYYAASDAAAPGNFISKTTSVYASALSPTKVFNLKTTSSQQYNGLENTSTETSSIVYDNYNNPTESTTWVKEGGTTKQTTINNVTYAAPTIFPNVVGRPVNKTQSITVSGDTMTSEEQYAYNTTGLLTQIKKKGHNTNFITEDNVYDAFGNITKKNITATGLTARETNYEYDSSGRFLTKSTDVEGLITTFAYNANNGLLNSQTNPYGLTTSYLYDPWFKKTKITDYLGKSNTYSYTRSNEKSKITVTGDDGSYSEELYDDQGRKLTASVKDLNGNTSSVSYLYDIHDRNFKVSEPYSGSSPTQWNETKYDAYGRPAQNISFTGKTTTISYSVLTTTVNDGTKTKATTKNAMGNVVSLTDTPGGTITYTYFANGNLRSSNYDGVAILIEQNGWGRKTKLTDPSAGEYTYAYNDFGEVLTETSSNGNYTTTYTPDAVGKLTTKTIKTGTNTNSTTTYAYDSTSKLLTSSTFVDASDNNATTTTAYTYDATKRLVSSVETTPYATFTKQLTYDAFGRVNTETSIAGAAGKTSSKTIQHTYKNGSHWQLKDNTTQEVLWQTNTVNVRGQLTGATMANGNIAIANTYDSFGFASQSKYDKTGTTPVNIMTLNTVFDPQKGNLSSRTNGLFNQTENFEYDNQDRLTITTTEKAFLQQTSNDNNVTGYETEGGATTSNSGGALVTQAAIAGSALKKTLLTGAAIGDKISINLTAYRVGGSDTFNVYIQEVGSGSALYFKKELTSGTGSNTFEHTVTQYATLVLRIEKVSTTANNTFVVTGLTASRISKTTQAYDDRGRITQNELGTYNYTNTNKVYQNTSVTVTPEALTYYQAKPLQTISYNAFKSPVEITEQNGADRISFAYNDNNNRSAMFYGGLQTDKVQRRYQKYYSADGSMEIKVDTQNNNAAEIITYIGGNAYTAPIVLKSNGTTQNYLYLLRDYQGSILAITDAAGAVIEKRLFDAWGAILKVQDGAGTTLNGLTVLDRGYTGHEHLQSVGLIHMNGRLYDPKLHRFLQTDNYVQDPGNTQNYNRYGYVLNNPLKYTDPSGWLTEEEKAKKAQHDEEERLKNEYARAYAEEYGRQFGADGITTQQWINLGGAGVNSPLYSSYVSQNRDDYNNAMYDGMQRKSEIEEKYPGLYKALSKLQSYVKNNETVMKYFTELSGFSEAETLSILSIKSLVKLVVVGGTGEWGQFFGDFSELTWDPGHIHIRDIVATSLDNGGYNDKVFGTQVGMNGSSFFAGVVVLHELVHYGRYWNFMPNKYIENNKYYEAGQTFESWSFGSIQNYEKATKSAVKNGW